MEQYPGACVGRGPRGHASGVMYVRCCPTPKLSMTAYVGEYTLRVAGAQLNDSGFSDYNRSMI